MPPSDGESATDDRPAKPLLRSPGRGSCLLLGLVALFACGFLGALVTLLAMTLGVFVAPLAIVGAIFLLIGLQYLLWRGLGLFADTEAPPEPVDDTTRF